MPRVVGLFDGFSEAQRVTQTLVAQGIRGEDIAIVANRAETSVGEVLAVAALGMTVDGGPASRGEPAALHAFGVPADEAPLYAMALDGGGALVSVLAAEPQADQVCELMERSASADLAVPGIP
jgi:hypothetical protein